MEIHIVNGAAGVKLHVGEYGKSSGVPILLIHGWSQSYLCWAKQFGSALKDEARIVALDLRGHGMSDARLRPINIPMATNRPGLFGERAGRLSGRPSDQHCGNS